MQTAHPTALRGGAARRRVVFATTALAGLISQAYAQQAAPADAAPTTVTVTGIRASLDNAARAKREAVGLTDSIHAEDMGKFPDNNVAESIARIPGVQISREVTGEGLNIQIRGLGSSFTRVLLNGAPVSSASTGINNFGQANREVDLDFLPGDLFTKITVAKSPDAGMLEGGIAGTVDMRLARPFDKKGKRGFISVQATKNQTADKMGTRGAAMFSNTFDNGFGVLAGFAWANNPVHVKGFESVGYTNANLSATQNTATTRNNTGGGNFSVPGTVPAAAAGTYNVNGTNVTLTSGQTIDQALLLSLNPGATIQQIDNGLVARLPRPVDIIGDRDRVNAVLGFEWRPSADLQAYVDIVGGKKRNAMVRSDLNIAVRNNQLIPMGMSFDRSDCTTGCTVTGATFANAQGFLEYRPWHETTDFWSFNPGVEWRLNDSWTVDGAFNATQSQFHRDSPTVLTTTNPNTPATINYVNNGSIPTYTSSLDMNNPANFGWYAGNNLIAFAETRRNTTEGVRANVSWSADPSLTVRGGLSHDNVARRIRSFNDNSAWANQTRNTLVPTASLPGYLTRDSLGYVTMDWKRFAEATGLAAIADHNVEGSGGTNAGTTPGYFQEKIDAFYGLVEGNVKLLGNDFRYNVGVRSVHTDQIIGTLSGTGPTLAEARQTSSYSNTLPSATAVYNLTKDVLLRAAVSKSMTRPDPTQMRVLSLSFTDPAASSGTLTNPDLKPYLSNNVDVGVEWYTSKTGYLAAAYFQKSVRNFTASVNTTVPFSALAQYGVTYATLTAQQQTAIDNRGGPNATTVTLSQAQNTADLLKIHGLELTWSQPLDFLPVKGFGFTSNYTRVLQSGGPSGFIATGVAPWTANFSGYYEVERGSVRVSHTYTRGAQLTVSPQNGLNVQAAQLYSNNYSQTDLSSRLEIGDWVGWKPGVSLSFDVWNLSNTKQRRYFQFENAAYDRYEPGRSYFAGLRAKF